MAGQLLFLQFTNQKTNHGNMIYGPSFSPFRPPRLDSSLRPHPFEPIFKIGSNLLRNLQHTNKYSTACTQTTAITLPILPLFKSWWLIPATTAQPQGSSQSSRSKATSSGSGMSYGTPRVLGRGWGEDWIWMAMGQGWITVKGDCTSIHGILRWLLWVWGA